jgi:GT2 family glycosyltransferase
VNIGVVAIGRNEGERLRSCLASATRDGATVVYVDSGSTDGSVELAKSLGVQVLPLDLSLPFTAARARNEGFAKLREIEPAVAAIQFVDGDCEIAAGWIAAASTALSSDDKTAVVCGRRRERFPDATIYNRLCDLEWDTPIGIAKSCGGDALIRVSAFEQVGGFNPAVIAGEEPEMCVRLRRGGWIIRRIDAEMTLHDAAITRFAQWWKRNVRAGHAYTQGYFLHGSPPEFFRAREVRSIHRWVLAPCLLTIGTAVVLALIASRFTALGLLPLLLYPLLAFRVALQRRRRGTPFGSSLLYGVSVALGKFPQFFGMRQFYAKQRRGEQSTIIEYKTSSTAGN